MKLILITFMFFIGVMMNASEMCKMCPCATHCTDSKIAYPEVAICGLYCKTCPAFGKDCDGCLSSRVAESCKNCPNGFRDCAQKKGVTRCYQCDEFPCDRLLKFSKTHIVNGIKHHEKVIDNLQMIKDSGVKKWVEKEDFLTQCRVCDERILWHEVKTHQCKQK